MGKKYLIDTNTLLEYAGNFLPANASQFVDNIINEEFNISIINRIEVLGHSSATIELVDFINLANQYDLTDSVVQQTIDLRKIKKIKLPDAIIAATAIAHGFILVSRNTKDFQNIQGLEVVNPYNS